MKGTGEGHFAPRRLDRLLIPLLLFIIVTLYGSVNAHWTQHHRYNNHRTLSRQRRQFFPGGEAPQQIDLNITVPFIFSARLYPYGVNRGDNLLDPNVEAQAFVLKHPLTFIGRNTTVLYIHRNGAVGFEPNIEHYNREQAQFPHGPRMIAVYWTPAKLGNFGRVYFRETEDHNILKLAKGEVQIQYGYGDDFEPKSVMIITWEDLAPAHAPDNLPKADRNLFQIALILSDNGTFAHFVYSKLRWNDNAIAGFNEGGQGDTYIRLPGSGTLEAIRLANLSDIGIPGEWLFKIDEYLVYMCGPGFTGSECINKCEPGMWYYDCVRQCHCAGGQPCNIVNGACASNRCREGWTNAPVCDIDIDECEQTGAEQLCPSAQPDCVNTPGAYICMCLAGYDNTTNSCRGYVPSDGSRANEKQLVEVVPIQPQVVAPRLIVPGRNVIQHAPRPRLPQFVTPFVQNVGFTAKVRTLAPGETLPPRTTPSSPLGVNTPRQRPPPQGFHVTPRTIVPNFQPNNGRDGGGVGRGRGRGGGDQFNPFDAIKPSTNIHQRPDGSFAIGETPGDVDPNQEQIFIGANVPHEIQPHFGPPTQTRASTPPPVPSTCSLQCNQHSHCVRQPDGSQSCVCNTGFTGDGEFCVDINECFVNNPCQGQSRCHNIVGGYTCLCDEGYVSQGDGCVDVDECVEDEIECPGGNKTECINTVGSFECRCKQGYNGDPLSAVGCIDINECLIPEFYCGANAHCRNHAGSFECICHDGYILVEGVCQDIDECVSVPCHRAATCTNTLGSFTCTCLDGYAGDGKICQESILFPFNREEDQRMPPEVDAAAELPLRKPVTIFGTQYDRLFLSVNGMMSFDQPLLEYNPAPFEHLPLTGFSPLYMRTDLTQGGSIFVKQPLADGASATDFSTITRANLNVHEKFKDENFRADHVIVVTFDNVKPIGFHSPSTYQMVVASGVNGTYVMYIYGDINAPTGAAGVLSNDPSAALKLPGSTNGDMKALKQNSNIGEPGRWMFRVDQPVLVACPAGKTGPPMCTQGCQPGFWGQNCAQKCRCAQGIPCDFASGYCANQACESGWQGVNCQQDMDECLLGLHRCHPVAQCNNHIGGYICTCPTGMVGDGFNCEALNACSQRFGRSCSPQAECLLDHLGQGNCICLEGQVGDGFTCTPAAATQEQITSVAATFPTPAAPIAPRTRPAPEVVFVSPHPPPLTVPTPPHRPPVTPARSPLTRPPPFIDHNRIAPPPSTPRRPQPPPQPPRRPPSQPGELDNRIDSSSDRRIADRGEAVQPGFEQAQSSNLLVILVPAALCGIWLILIVVLLVVCLKRRKQRQRSKYGLGYYMPPAGSNTLQTSTAMAQQAASTSRSANLAANSGVPTVNSAYASQWSIPRPQYDYYQGAYFPQTYTTAYKY